MNVLKLIGFFAIVALIFLGSSPASAEFKHNYIEEKSKQIEAEHNKYRKMHGVPNLELQEDLSASAQKWADNLAERDGILTHRKPLKYGENSWMAEGGKLKNLMSSELNPVKDWYSEREFYTGTYESSTFTKYGHFTQLIWKSSKKLGVGISVSAKGNIFVVCHYKPRGNIMNEFQENVPSEISGNASEVHSSFSQNGQESVQFGWISLFMPVICVILSKFAM